MSQIVVLAAHAPATSENVKWRGICSWSRLLDGGVGLLSGMHVSVRCRHRRQTAVIRYILSRHTTQRIWLGGGYQGYVPERRVFYLISGGLPDEYETKKFQ